ncbi:MAG: sigma-70 family RNA polymerase sigma factor, partial [Candidatus Eremiobacteraeota bacterium]|nr:sigma-70 family RNA polymerase sigma factor [Candidatus Eremiobacteraeota bacterium]
MALRIEPPLVEAARRGGPPLEELIRAVWPEAYRIAFAILRDRGLAEDAAQDACAAIAGSVRTLRHENFFATWSYRIITNAAISLVRRRQANQNADTAICYREPFDYSGSLDLQIALDRLSPVQRALILLHYYAGLASGDLAAATGLASSTVRFHLMGARRALRKALEVRNPTAPRT